MLNRMKSYSEKVVRKEIPAWKEHIAACQRFLDDLERDDLIFDNSKATRACKFIELLPHVQGIWAKRGELIKLEDWQVFIIGNIFGWYRLNGKRRFNYAYVEIPRKNAKTTLCAGIGLYGLIADDEQGAEVYSAATIREQAKKCFDIADAMVKKHIDLRKRTKQFRNNLNVPLTMSKFEPLGADADTMDGLNVHIAIIDELHAHKKRATWDVLETATGARENPIIIAITTAGFDRNGICFEQREYIINVLRKVIEDDSYFGFITSIDEGDDWTDPKSWAKANPNLDISVTIESMERECRKAKEVPTAQNNFLTKRLNVWTQQNVVWIDIDLWDKNMLGVIPEAELRHRNCYGALDLSSVKDITSFTLAFPRDDLETVDFLWRFWCPVERLYARDNRYADQYIAWEKLGVLTTTPGDAVDYDYVKQQILQDAEYFRMIDMNVDRLFNAHQLSMQLQEEGINIQGMGQGTLSYTAPMTEFERRLMHKRLNHMGNPMVKWMANNMSVELSPSGGMKPDKANSQGKIDGIVTMIMSLDRVMRHEELPKESIYKKRGVIVL